MCFIFLLHGTIHKTIRIKMDKRILIGIVCTIVVVAGFSIALFVRKEGLGPQSPAEPTKVTVQLKWEHQAQFAGIYVAKEKGLYEEQGLYVNYRAWRTRCSSSSAGSFQQS